jgi:hypothetical protein
MPGLVALAGVTALLALSGCFQLSPKSCEVLCEKGQGCPGNLQCVIQPNANYGICTAPNDSCLPPFPEAGMPLMDASTPDAASDAGDAGAPLPPGELCHNGACFTLPDAIRANLVLLLWPSNLPPVGSTVSLWKDQSGQGNDAHALIPTAPPKAIPDGVQLDSSQLGTGFVVVNSPSLDFGADDFAVIVVEGLSSSTTPVTLLRKSDQARTNKRQISIDWVLSPGASALTGHPEGAVDDTTIPAAADIAQPSVTAYTLYRATNHVELRVNESVVASADLSPDVSTSNSADVYIGTGTMFASAADSIEAVIAIRGTVGSTVLNQLDVFVRDVFAKPAP